MRAYDHWLRALTSTPLSYASSASEGGGAATDSWTSAPPGVVDCIIPGRGWPGSVISHPRIEVAVGDVGDEIEEDHYRRGDHQPGHDRIWITGVQRPDEVEAHPVQREHGLGHDRAAEERTEVEGDERDERNERVPKSVPPRHVALRHALRARRAHVVGVDDLEHGGAHVPRVRRDARDHQDQHGKREVPGPVSDEVEPSSRVDGAEARYREDVVPRR